jgi:hypothetical protein
MSMDESVKSAGEARIVSGSNGPATG